ncbi:MAG: hypothetical protein PXZ08_00530 [Actinomycetota bacterium]|nr:hypothetical protein [Actinomycetota bacterium]
MSDEVPETEGSPGELEQYAIVASRRQQWDTLLWQMPTMVLTGEAFLFTISLGAQTSRTGRIIAATLSLLVALASLHSLASHRMSELADSAWLHEYELAHEAPVLHGLSWRVRRQNIIAAQRGSSSVTDRLVSLTGTVRSIVVWFWTMALITVAAAITLVLAAGWPQLLTH